MFTPTVTKLDPARKHGPALSMSLATLASSTALMYGALTVGDFKFSLPDTFTFGALLSQMAQGSFGHSHLLLELLALLVGSIGGLATYRSALMHTPLREAFTQESDADPHVYYGDDALRDLTRRLRAEAGASAPKGIYLAPFLPLPREAETKNILVMGAPGSGKSNIIRAVTDQMIERQDRLLLLCAKGDVTAAFDNRDAVYIAVHDDRSHALDLAADVTDSASAAQFAADIIPKSSPPFWSDSARAVLTDLILHLNETDHGSWTAGTLLRLLSDNAAALRERIKGMKFNAGPLIEANDPDAEDKTVVGILITLRSAALANLRPLAWAWDDLPVERRFSVRRWLADGYTGKRTVIVQYSAQYSAISSLVTGNLIRSIARTLSDPSTPNNPRRRVALILDEFHMLDKIDGFAHALAVGREKGLVTILGCQTYNQLVSTYGEDDAASIMDMFAFRIFGLLPSGRSAEYAERLLGSRRIVRNVRNETPAAGDKRRVISVREAIPTFGASRFASDLGITKQDRKWMRSIRLFNRFRDLLARFIPERFVFERFSEETTEAKITAVLQARGQVYVLEWPLTTWIERRPGFIPAPWLSKIPSNS